MLTEQCSALLSKIRTLWEAWKKFLRESLQCLRWGLARVRIANTMDSNASLVFTSHGVDWVTESLADSENFEAICRTIKVADRYSKEFVEICWFLLVSLNFNGDWIRSSNIRCVNFTLKVGLSSLYATKFILQREIQSWSLSVRKFLLENLKRAATLISVKIATMLSRLMKTIEGFNMLKYAGCSTVIQLLYGQCTIDSILHWMQCVLGTTFSIFEVFEN